MESISVVAAMTTISITEETQTELRKIKGQLMASNGKERSFDDVIMELIKDWKVRRSVNEC
jgi:predicted CopG family antitoxin